ncbi:MAG: DUF1080 domain-containing protein [Planctomycetes bacterium]|nr:DUF1080 domain-containing protein [Planctomycetota bacterium]
MKTQHILTLLVTLSLTGVTVAQEADTDGWISLFNGKDLEGWRASENKTSFTVQDGAIVAYGKRSHLYYEGPVNNAMFKNFEYKVDVMTEPGSNGGLYFHTQYLETGWPSRGHEVQVNNTFEKDPRRTGSLYRKSDVPKEAALPKDNEWFTEHIHVRGNRVVVKVNGKTFVDWTQPDGQTFTQGTFALQGHDPKSRVHYKNIYVKPLPDDLPTWTAPANFVPLFDGKSLEGWEQKNGTAHYEVEDGAIKGTTVEGSPNSFLCSKPFSDFELHFEVLVDSRLNSGVQIRSNSLPEYRNGRVHGYQVEIATNGTAGFIYDEARRGWLSEDRTDPAAQAAFKDGEWNRYRVVCVGDSIRTWVNGVPVAEVVDSMTATGFFGLQVHSLPGDSPAWVKWRNIEIKELKPTHPD